MRVPSPSALHNPLSKQGQRATFGLPHPLRARHSPHPTAPAQPRYLLRGQLHVPGAVGGAGGRAHGGGRQRPGSACASGPPGQAGVNDGRRRHRAGPPPAEPYYRSAQGGGAGRGGARGPPIGPAGGEAGRLLAARAAHRRGFVEPPKGARPRRFLDWLSGSLWAASKRRKLARIGSRGCDGQAPRHVGELFWSRAAERERSRGGGRGRRRRGNGGERAAGPGRRGLPACIARQPQVISPRGCSQHALRL